MQLRELGDLLMLSYIIGEETIEIMGIQSDSRKVRPGDLFICLDGYRDDGHRYADSAVERGAVALVAQYELDVPVPTLVVKDSQHALAVIANHYYNYPSHELKIIGVTGTNGKTTTTYLLDRILSDHGFVTGLMGTIQMKIQDHIYQVNQTTQGALELQRNLRKMKNVETQYCLMEVSSHALKLGRVKGCHFRTTIFTNLSQDHLDYHKTMEQYRDAKGLLFARMGNVFYPKRDDQQFAIFNIDDPYGTYFSELTTAQTISYGIEKQADVRAIDITITAKGTSFTAVTFKGTMMFNLRLVGKFSVYNALAAIAASLVEGVPLQAIKQSLEHMTGIPGRFEVIDAGQSFLTIVDYAHTPDSLENVLMTIREFATGQILCVFGCGGDRDRGKRAIMGRIAAQYCDHLFITSDNPRFEDPHAILLDIEQGIKDTDFSQDNYELIVDRKKAIHKAIVKASPKDVILIAGKGHETYQEINGMKEDFDDRIVAKNALRSFLSDKT